MPADDVVRVSILADVQNAVSGFAKAALGAGAAYLSFKKLLQVTKESFNAFMESEDAQTRLAAAIRITGQQSTISVRALASYAAQLQKLTNVEDEASMAAMGTLMQLGDLTQEGVKKAMPALIDFAKFWEMDLNSAASLFGKTLGSDTNALARYGVQIEKNLDPHEKLNAIVEQLNRQVGGFAETLTTTTSGKLESMKIQVGELKEAFGGLMATIMQSEIAQTALGHTSKELERLSWIMGGWKVKVEDISKYTKQQLVDYNTTLNEARTFWENLAAGDKRYAATAGKEIASIETRMADINRRLSRGQYAPAPAGAPKPGALVTGGGAGGDEDEQAALQRQRLAEATAWMSDEQRAYNQDMENGAVSLDTYNALMWQLEQRNAAAAEAKEKQAAAIEKMIALAEAESAALNPSYAQEDFEAMALAAEDWAKRNEAAQEKAKEDAKKSAEETRTAWENALGAIGEVMDRLAGISDQYWRNQEGAIDNEYEARRDAIDDTITDEAKKAEALAALDEEFETRRKKMAHDQAVADKALGIFTSLVDTAQAVVKALASASPPANFVLAGIVGAMGAAQTALIAAQPIPALARGGEFDVPPGFPADSYPMRVSSGEHVAVTPAGAGGGGEPLHAVIQLDGKTLFDAITRASRDRRILTDRRSLV